MAGMFEIKDISIDAGNLSNFLTLDLTLTLHGWMKPEDTEVLWYEKHMLSTVMKWWSKLYDDPDCPCSHTDYRVSSHMQMNTVMQQARKSAKNTSHNA